MSDPISKTPNNVPLPIKKYVLYKNQNFHVIFSFDFNNIVTEKSLKPVKVDIICGLVIYDEFDNVVGL